MEKRYKVQYRYDRGRWVCHRVWGRLPVPVILSLRSKPTPPQSALWCGDKPHVCFANCLYVGVYQEEAMEGDWEPGEEGRNLLPPVSFLSDFRGLPVPASGTCTAFSPVQQQFFLWQQLGRGFSFSSTSGTSFVTPPRRWWYQPAGSLPQRSGSQAFGPFKFLSLIIPTCVPTVLEVVASYICYLHDALGQMLSNFFCKWPDSKNSELWGPYAISIGFPNPPKTLHKCKNYS